MFDQESLRPVIIAMSLYLIISSLIPRIVTKPTGVGFIDDLVMYLIALELAQAQVFIQQQCSSSAAVERCA